MPIASLTQRRNGLIPSSLSIDFWYPGVGEERRYSARLSHEPVPGIAGGADDGVVIAEEAVERKWSFRSSHALRLPNEALEPAGPTLTTAGHYRQS